MSNGTTMTARRGVQLLLAPAIGLLAALGGMLLVDWSLCPHPGPELAPAPRTLTAAVAVEVRQKGTERPLVQSRVAVYRAPAESPGRDAPRDPGPEGHEGPRTSEVAWDSGETPSARHEASLEPGSYRIVVRCPRFAGDERVVTAVEGAQSVAFELERAGTIRGRVLAADGSPVEGARVTALPDLSRPRAPLEELLTDFIDIALLADVVADEDLSLPDGSYQLDLADPGRWYTVRAVAPGHASREVPGVAVFQEPVDLVLEETVPLGGLVVGPDGSGVAGAMVSAYAPFGGKSVFPSIVSKVRPPLDRVRSGVAGEFRFETFAPGVYDLVVEAPGHAPGHWLDLPLDSRRGDLVLGVGPDRAIRGVVRGPGGEPVSGATVRVHIRSPRRPEARIDFRDDSVLTDAQGRFAVGSLADGDYDVLCSHPLHETVRMRAVRPTAGAAEVVLDLQGGATLRGRVLDARTDGPIRGANVSIGDIGPEPRTATSAADGRFAASGLRRGRPSWYVTIAASGFGTRRGPVDAVRARGGEVTFRLEPGAGLSGVVLGRGHRPLADALIHVRSADGESGRALTLRSCRTDGQGRFECLDLEAPCEVRLEVRRRDHIDWTSEAFALQPGRHVEAPPIVLRPGGTVAGRVVDPTGAAIPGCEVTVVASGAPWDWRALASRQLTHTDASGGFQVEGLTADIYDVLVEQEGFRDSGVMDEEVREGEARTLPPIVLVRLGEHAARSGPDGG